MQDTKTFGFLKQSLTGIPEMVIKPVKQAKTTTSPSTLATNSTMPDKTNEGKNATASKSTGKSGASTAKVTTTGGGVRRKAKEANKKKSIAAKKVS